MRTMAIVLAVMTTLAAPAWGADAPAGRVDARMLLDLDLLAETDPAQHRDQSVAERMRLLEMLRMLESPAGAASSPPSTPATRTPALPSPSDGGTR